MSLPSGRGRGRHGRPRPSAEQLPDHSIGDDAPQIRAPSRSRDIGGDSFLYGRPTPSRGRASPGASRGRASPSPSRGRPLSPPCRDCVTEPPSAQMLQQPKVSYLNKLLGTTTLKESSITATSSSLGSPILVRRPTDWPLMFYIRIDLGGSFHTYPHLGGPFQSLQEAETAIDCHLRDREHPTMFKQQDGVSLLDISIRKCMYWPDGTRKKCPKSQMIEEGRSQIHLLVQALVDKYNEDHNLLGDLAYELKDVVDYQHISEGNGYYHFNFTAETKGAADFGCGINNLFFAELTFREREKMMVSCFCMVKPNDNGHCYGCVNRGSVNMKHPNNSGAYAGGHLDLPSGCCDTVWIDDYDEDEKAEEDRLRFMFKGLDNPKVEAKLFSLPPGATPVEEMMRD